MRERSKGKTLVARDEGDDADGVVSKLYGEETNGLVSDWHRGLPGGSARRQPSGGVRYDDTSASDPQLRPHKEN